MLNSYDKVLQVDRAACCTSDIGSCGGNDSFELDRPRYFTPTKEILSTQDTNYDNVNLISPIKSGTTYVMIV